MSRKRTGSVRLKRGKYLAEMAGEYLGSYDSEAEAWEAIAAAQLLDSDRAPDSLRGIGEAFFAAREKGGVVDVENERGIWRTRIETAAFSDWPLRRVRPRDVDEWLRSLSDEPAMHAIMVGGEKVLRDTGRKLSRQTISHARRVLMAAFQWAAVRGKVSANPVREVKLPKNAGVAADDEDRDDMHFLQPDEVLRLFAAIDGCKSDERRAFYRAVYTVAIYQGLRQGEIWGLRWQDLELDGERPTLRVRKSYAGPPKTRRARRDIPLQDATLAALDAWRRVGGVVRATGLVFPSHHGGCYARGSSANWDDRPYTDKRGGAGNERQRVWRGWRSKAGIRPVVTFHDLRHTCLTYLTHGLFGFRRLSVEDVADWAGHADLKTTRRYVHAIPSSLHEAIRGESEKSTRKR